MPTMSRAADKQLPLFEPATVRECDLETDADRQERYRLSRLEKKADEARHARWLKHNTGGFNCRSCPCRNCTGTRRGR